jgi:hypothetical protein
VEMTSLETGGPRVGRSARIALAGAIALLALLVGARGAEAAVSAEEAQHAAERGAAWFAAEQQSASGSLLGDWGMTALAAAGTNAADVHGAGDPSAQDFYLGEWQTKGPGGAATDSERAVLAGAAGGIQTSRVAAGRNLVAQVAGFWSGEQIGAPGLLNDDIFGVLALDRVDAPQSILEADAEFIASKQLADGGFSWSNAAGAPSESDMTGAAIGALCDAGADPSTDPTIQKALAYLHTRQDPTTGGFSSPPFFPVNTDSTGWVASGLISCGIDPQSLEWTTSEGKTAFDYLLSMQTAQGYFCWKTIGTCDSEGSTAYTTWDSVRPLAGDSWSATAPEREVAGEPAIRPAPSVAAGTTVPIALVIDYGNGEADMCRIKVPSGTDLATALTDARTTSQPEGCVTGATVSDSAGGETLGELNGVTPATGSRWLISVDGGPEEAKTTAPIGFGDMLSLRLEGTGTKKIEPPALTVPAAAKGALAATDHPRAKLSGAHRAKVSGNQVGARLSCPRGLGPEGCVGTVTIRYRHGGKARTGGQAGFALGSGASRKVKVTVRPALRRLLAASGRRSVSLVATTRSVDGITSSSSADIVLVGPRPRGH